MPQYVSQGVAVDDVYRRLSDLLGIATPGARTPEAVLQAQDGAVLLRLGDERQPAAASAGVSLAMDSTFSVGPVHRHDLEWPLDQIWVRKDPAAGAASIVMLGVVT